MEVIEIFTAPVVLGFDSSLGLKDAECIVVEHDRNDIRGGDGDGTLATITIGFDRGDVDGLGVAQRIIIARSLPIWDFLIEGEFDEVIVVCGRLEIRLDGFGEIRVHNNVEFVRGGVTGVSILIEEDGVPRETFGIKHEDFGRITEESRILHRLRTSERLDGRIIGMDGLVHGKEMHASRRSIGVDGDRDHVVDGGEHEFLEAKFHGIANLRFDHGHKIVHGIEGGKSTLDLLLGFGDVDGEGHAFVEEFLRYLGEIDDERVNGRTIDEFKSLVCGRLEEVGLDFAEDRTPLPRFAVNGGEHPIIGTIDVDIADESVVDRAIERIEFVGVLKGCSNVNDVLEILGHESRVLTHDVLDGIVKILIDLCRFHCGLPP